MTSFHEGKHAAQFILTEANGQRSRDSVNIPTGKKFSAGTVLVTATGSPYVSGAGPLCVAIYGADTTAAGAVAIQIACIARDAELNRHAMSWTNPYDDTAIGAAATELAKAGVIIRGTHLPSPADDNTLAADETSSEPQQPPLSL